ncbi:hypothetical protein [Paenibacillus prosopidis]|uniref:Uncharacterized protein n=1 Tax=Paenibacillus prosopidis TaxID=630520 RepID=A0A368VJW3_9BACL|nr:hypothetical protein [Paenibacillus prosopidis]RCW41618.1 hypothetical protein DFP97_12254 [Paenibacillus prosopidis]
MKAIENYMKKTLNIDPDCDEIGWYINHEDGDSLSWRFSHQGKNYRVTYNKKSKKVTSGTFFPPKPSFSRIY